MKFLIVIGGYFKWHYSRALVSTTQIWKNILSFLFNFFSIKQLTLDFFLPWRRNADNYKKKFDIKAFFETLLINTLMRIVGVLTRSIVIIIGLLVCTLFILTYPFVIIVWLLSPIFVVYLFILGLILIFS